VEERKRRIGGVATLTMMRMMASCELVAVHNLTVRINYVSGGG